MCDGVSPFPCRFATVSRLAVVADVRVRVYSRSGTRPYLAKERILNQKADASLHDSPHVSGHEPHIDLEPVWSRSHDHNSSRRKLVIVF